MTKVNSNPFSIRIAAAPPANAPAWLQGVAVNQWVQIPNTTASVTLPNSLFAGVAGDPKNHLAYSGAALRKLGSWFLVFGGGHADYYGNDVVGIQLNHNTPTWQLLRAPTVPPDISYWSNASYQGIWWNTTHLPDGRPASRHSYKTMQFIDIHDKLYTFGAPVTAGTSNVSGKNVDAFSWVTKDWDAKDTHPPLPYIHTAIWPVKHPVTNDVYTGSGDSYVKWTAATDTWSYLISGDGWNHDTGIAALDSTRNRILRLGTWNDGYKGFPILYQLTTMPRITGNSTWPNPPFQPLSGTYGANFQTPNNYPGQAGFEYVPDIDKYLLFPDDGYVYTIDPVSFAVERLPVTGAVPPPDSRYAVAGGSGVATRFRYVPELKGCVYMSKWTENLYFLRLA